MFGLLSQYWLDQHHADGEVLLTIRAEQQHSYGSYIDCKHVVARVPIHCIVASSASTYFSTLLSPAWRQQQQGPQQCSPVQLVLGEPADIAAMIALLKCIYTGALDVDTTDLYSTLQPGLGSCSCSSAVRECLSSAHWQQLYFRVIRLADQYAVHGVMDVAISKLTNLFSHQLEWSTIEAVLWMPTSMSTEPRMGALRQLAVSGVKQRLGVLDDALAQPSGRLMLQSLPPDALAAILGADTLPVTSENSVLAAVDIWLAGPVAQTLAQQSNCSADNSGASTCCNSYHSMADNHGPCSAMITILPPSMTKTSSRTCCLQLVVSDDSEDSTDSGTAGHGTAHTPLDAALTLLTNSVRLAQCSGAFLAAAVERMPWLCKALQHKAGDLQLLQQYYSSDSEGRYQLAMHLIQQTISCPWQPKLRKALPMGFSSSSSNTGTPGTSTLLSELRTLLDTTQKQQLAHKVRLFQAVCSAANAPPGVALSEFVMGGYLWRLSLVGAPHQRLCSSPDIGIDDNGSVSAAAAAAAAAEEGAQGQQQQLAICIICRPAWAANLDSFSSSNSKCPGNVGAAGERPEPAAVAAASALLGQGSAAVPDCACMPAAGSAKCDVHVMAAGADLDIGSRCSVCRSLCGIAMSKAAAAVKRHLPGAASDSSGSNVSSSDGCGGSNGGRPSWSCAQDVVVGVNVTAAPSAALLQALVGVNASKPPVEAYVPVRLSWSDETGAAWGLVPLDVSGIGSGSSNLVCGWACQAGNAPAGAVYPAIPAADGGAVGVNPAAAGAEAAAAGNVDGVRADGRLIVGWQPELWSRLGYTGELHWHSSLRLLSD